MARGSSHATDHAGAGAARQGTAARSAAALVSLGESPPGAEIPVPLPAPGETLVYHQGLHLGTCNAWIARAMRRAAEAGRVVLVQRRLCHAGDEAGRDLPRFAYLAVGVGPGGRRAGR